MKEKLQEKGHILHNWNEAVSFVIFLGGFYLLGETVSTSWMGVGNTRSIMCKKQQNDSINIPLIALCYVLKKTKLLVLQIIVSGVEMMQTSSLFKHLSAFFDQSRTYFC